MPAPTQVQLPLFQSVLLPQGRDLLIPQDRLPFSSMPDPLDPTDAIVSAFTDMLTRSVAFLAVTAGSAILGWNIHQSPTVLSNFTTQGFAAFQQAYDSIDPSLIPGWLLMMLHSFFILWTLPFALFYFWLFIRLWRDGDLFQILFFLAISHSLHTFIYLQRNNPLSGGALAAALGALVVAEAVTVGLLLWWQQVTESAPPVRQEHEAEPEL